jgi:predicted transcriptional regulator
MSARCETIGKYIMPVFRALVAKELVNVYHLTQVEAAQMLGTTQVSISQYVNSKRATRGIKQFGKVLPKIQVMASKTAKRLLDKEILWEEVMRDFCTLCVSFSDEEIKPIKR